MRILKWIVGLVILGLIALWLFVHPFSFLIRCFFFMLLSGFLCLYRVMRGPTAADRLVSVDILGILIVGFCAILSLSTGRTWYMDIGIAWALQSFIGVLALTKYLEGRAFDD